MLTNHDMDSHSPFACLLVGQPTLRRRIKLGALAALDQRIGLRYAMPPMTADETASYLPRSFTLIHYLLIVAVVDQWLGGLGRRARLGARGARVGAPVPLSAGWCGWSGRVAVGVRPGAGLAGAPTRWPGRVTIASRVGSSGFVVGRG
jgi:hypothetical protein